MIGLKYCQAGWIPARKLAWLSNCATLGIPTRVQMSFSNTRVPIISGSPGGEGRSSALNPGKLISSATRRRLPLRWRIREGTAEPGSRREPTHGSAPCQVCRRRSCRSAARSGTNRKLFTYSWLRTWDEAWWTSTSSSSTGSQRPRHRKYPR